MFNFFYLIDEISKIRSECKKDLELCKLFEKFTNSLLNH